MVIDKRLLERARVAGAKLTAADRAALLARAEYNTVVRRLHLGGGSLREIAEALEMSHQRVQQIVDAAGGSWWQKVWRTRTPRRDAVCTFCGLPPSEVKKLVAGPDVYTCEQCVSNAEKALSKGTARHFVVAHRAGEAKCSFCGKPSSAVRPVVTAADAAMCTECVKACREIIDDSAHD